MLAGPIIKYHEIRSQIESRSVSLEDVEFGVLRFLVGLAKKVLVADTVAEIVDKVFSASPMQLGNVNAWFGALCFAIQIYFDFSGYSDMALGLARTFGFRLRENFNQPYLAVGFADWMNRRIAAIRLSISVPSDFVIVRSPNATSLSSSVRFGR